MDRISTKTSVRAIVGAAACSAGLMSLLAPQAVFADPEFICPGTRYIYTSDVNVPDPANTATTCMTAYDGGTVASNGTFNTVTPFGSGWTVVTNIFGQLLQITNAVGITWNLGPLPGSLVAIGPSPALQTTYTYEPMGRVQTTTASGSQVTTYAYDMLNPSQMVTTTTPNGNVTTYTYTSGRPDLVTETDGGGHQVTYTYDSSSRPAIATESPGGRVQTYTYNDFDRTVTRVDSAGPTTTTYTYDASDRVTQVDDSNGNLTTYTYTAGNLTQVTETHPPDPVRITQYQYTSSGQVIEVLHPLNLTTCYQYDSAGHLTKYLEDDAPGCNSADALTTTFAYDFRGQLASIVDAQGEQARLAYVPAPGSLLLLGLGLGALALRRRRA